MGSTINIENFTRFGSARKNLSENEEKEFKSSEKLINKVSGSLKGTLHSSDIPCSEFSANSTCGGTLNVLITDIPNELRWSCPVCGSGGVIKNWRKSPSYKNICRERIIKKQSEATTLRLPFACYDYLSELVSGMDEFQEILSAGEKGDEEYIIPISEFNLLRLIEIIALRIEMRYGDRASLTALRDEIMNSFSRNSGI